MILEKLGRKSKGVKRFNLVTEDETGYNIIATCLNNKIETFNNATAIEWLNCGKRVHIQSLTHGCGSLRNMKDCYERVVITKAKKVEDEF